MPKHYTLNGEAARMARAAASELASLQRAMREAEDNLAGLHRMLKVPKTTTQRRTIKGSRSSSSALQSMLETSLGNFAASSMLSGGIGSFSLSSGQIAAELASASLKGQRIL
jgi:hypothetical protein